MAVLQMHNRQNIEISPEKGHELWLVLNGEKEGTAEQQEFCMRVKRLYLNWRRNDLPESYYERHSKVISELRKHHGMGRKEFSHRVLKDGQ